MENKKLEVRFYRTEHGAEPVREWLQSLDRPAKKVIGGDIKTVQYGWPLGMPLVRSLGSGLWEVRSHLPQRRIARVIFCMRNEKIVLLHGFIKKTPKTPVEDLSLAKRRKRELESEP
jgi:phage-related protein